MAPLHERTILLTGASKGIGAAMAHTLGTAGAHLVAHYGADLAGARAATAAIPDHRKLLISADLAQPDGAGRLWDEAIAWRGAVDVVINNAAVFINDGGFEDDEEAWDRVWTLTTQVNLLSPVELIRRAVPHFRTRGGGVLITISSWNAQRGSSSPRTAAYAASKAALRSATQTAARGYARDGVLAYVVTPGVVQTRMSEESAAELGGVDVVSAGLATGEWVPPSDVANLVAFLATGRSRHLSGATLDVNGASYIR